MVFVHARNETRRTAIALSEMSKQCGDSMLFVSENSPQYGDAMKAVSQIRI